MKSSIWVFSALLTMQTLHMPSAQAANGHLSGNLNGSGIASVVVVLGSIYLLDASGEVVVKSVVKLGDGVQVVLAGLKDGSQATLHLSGKAAEGFSEAIGSSGKLVATSTGHALMFAGKVVAFIPNQVGQALLHHSTANGNAADDKAKTQ